MTKITINKYSVEKSNPNTMRAIISYITNRNESFVLNVFFTLGITNVMLQSCGLKTLLMFNNTRTTRNAIRDKYTENN